MLSISSNLCRRGCETLESRVLLAVDLLSHVLPAPLSSNPGGFTSAGQYAYFWTDVGSDTRGLYRTDGTPEGTISLDIVVEAHVPLHGVASTDNSLFVRTADRLYVTQGTPASTRVLIENIHVLQHEPIVSFDGKVYFTAFDPDKIRSPWKSGVDIMVSDGTPEGTGYLVAEPSVSDDVVIQGVFDQELLYQYNHIGLPTGHQLWLSDSQNTRIVEPKAGGLSRMRVKTTHDDKFIGVFAGELAFVDRTTLQRTEVELGNEMSSRPHAFLTTPNRVFFTAIGDDNIRDVWETDGTVGGTRKVANFSNTWSDHSAVKSLTWFRNRLYFSADHAVWSYNPESNELGTIVPAIPPRLDRDDPPDDFVVFGDHMYFTKESERGREIWRTDGNTRRYRIGC